jgi:predicted acyl esterase
MMSFATRSIRRAAVAAMAMIITASHASAQVTTLPTEAPARIQPTNDGFDYERRDVMIPMRDGVKLHTVVLVPKGAHDAPILMTRTPYDATGLPLSPATTTRWTSLSVVGSSASCRTSAASTAPRATS